MNAWAILSVGVVYFVLGGICSLRSCSENSGTRRLVSSGCGIGNPARFITLYAGLGATLTGVNTILPTLPRAALFARITGSYHAAGITACAAILHAWR